MPGKKRMGLPDLDKNEGRLTTLRASSEAEKRPGDRAAENHNSRINEARIIFWRY